MYRYVAYRALWLALRRPLEASVGSTDGTQSQEYIRGLEEMREKIVICGCGQRKDYLDIYFTGVGICAAWAPDVSWKGCICIRAGCAAGRRTGLTLCGEVYSVYTL